jgi:hypothetical protein
MYLFIFLLSLVVRGWVGGARFRRFGPRGRCGGPGAGTRPGPEPVAALLGGCRARRAPQQASCERRTLGPSKAVRTTRKRRACATSRATWVFFSHSPSYCIRCSTTAPWRRPASSWRPPASQPKQQPKQRLRRRRLRRRQRSARCSMAWRSSATAPATCPWRVDAAPRGEKLCVCVGVSSCRNNQSWGVWYLVVIRRVSLAALAMRQRLVLAASLHRRSPCLP